MFNNIGSGEILVVLVVLLFLFGGKKLPEIARGIADAIKEFRKAFKDEGHQDSKKDTQKEDSKE